MSDTETKPVGDDKPRRRLNMTLDSYTLFAKPRTRKDRKQLRLTFGFSNGYPNVNVETDEEGEATLENGFMRVSSRMAAVNFNTMCKLIETATTQEPGWKQAIECYHTWKDGRQHEEAQHINDLIIGVDNQGMVFISISQAGRTTTKFVFGPTDWHNYKKENGDQWGAKELNHFCAIEHASGLKIAMNALIAADCMDNAVQKAGLPSPSVKPAGDGNFTKKPWDNNGGGNNFQKKDWNNNGGGGQGGYQKKPWQNNQGGGGYQKKPWQGNNGGGGGGYQGGGGGQGGYQKKPWNGGGGNNYQNGGGQGGGGGYQKKDWNNNRDQAAAGGEGGFKKPANTEIDLGEFDDL
jgi:uncharacterized membrane protein YgcG